uniref:Solute carrier family 13 member 2 n=1 Tax=Panagrellus redivivus TaxID=6233 RepID=A0A7E4ZV06_PANRE
MLKQNSSLRKRSFEPASITRGEITASPISKTTQLCEPRKLNPNIAFLAFHAAQANELHYTVDQTRVIRGVCVVCTMSFSDLKVSEDLCVYNSSRQTIISREELNTEKPLGIARTLKNDVRYITALLGYFRVIIWGFIVPLCFCPLLMTGRDEFKCVWCVLVLSIYWTAEIIPLPATALFPLFLFPLTGIMPPKAVAREYMNDTIFLFVGGLIVAAAVEKSHLHERIALRVLTLSGSQPKWVMFGFMSVTALLSMFISNTATTAMMVPIAQSVIKQLEVSYAAHSSEASLLQVPKKPQKTNSMLSKGMIISICFAANIGGTGTITGTPPNLVFIGQLANLFPNVNTGVNYLSFFLFAFPLMFLCLIACWMILVVYFLRKAPQGNDAVTKMIHDKYNNLPVMSFAEKNVSVIFVVMLLLWLCRAPEVVPGFGDLFEKGWYTDSTSSIIIVALLFILPSEKPKFLWPSREYLLGKKKSHVHANELNDDDVGIPIKSKKAYHGPQRLMNWTTMLSMFPWSVVWLLGGGFALAAGVKESGLSIMLGNILGQLDSVPLWILQVICVGAVMGVTNICSNTVTASIFIPIVSTLAAKTEVHPLTLMLPTTMACSFAFMLPVGTPPNAIVFSSGMLSVMDMIGSGFLVTLATLAITVGYMQSFAYLIFDISTMPEWSLHAVHNSTGV